jgi:uncharacterized surface protein with fasciclin (FAS1) repeats
MKNLLLFLIASATLLLMQSCGGGATEPTSGPSATGAVKGQSAVHDPLSEPNILQVAIGSKDHSTLVAGVQAASLEDVLSNAGPLTVFAPNNAAFDKLPAGTLETLLKPENKATLARIIKFHASPGSYTLEALRDGQQLYQATGHYIKVARDGDNVTINGARILGTVKASNGIVHVVDAVMLPPEE